MSSPNVTNLIWNRCRERVFGAVGQLSFSLGMFYLVFGINMVIFISLSGVFTQANSFTILLEATYFQVTSGPF